MLFNGWKSKKELKDALAAATRKGEVLEFMDYAEETSIFGPEYKGAGKYAVCMDHPKRTKFANITVNADGFITKVE
jgi:hypothetical protein